jgi:WD40 repeat protein
VWNVSSGIEQRDEPLTLYGHTAAVYDVVFSPDGQRLATASKDGTSRVYALPIDDLVTIAKSRLTRGLTTDECQKFLHVAQCPVEP